MTEPARNFAVIDTATGEVLEAKTTTVPREQYDKVARALEEAQDDLKDALRHKRSDGAKIRHLTTELNELLDSFAPDEEWDAFAAGWIRYTGRNPKRTKVDRGTDRCKHYKKLRKRFSRDEIALMVEGARHHHFAPFHDRDDMEDFSRSLKWAETCLRIGLERHPPKEKADG